MNPCCCTVPPLASCDICTEGSNVSIARYPGFVIDGGQFVGVTDISPAGFIIPAGCVDSDNGTSHACMDALNREWSLARLDVGRTTVGGDVCVDYFGETIDCASVVCWWYASNNWGCPGSCNPDVPDGNSVICLGGDNVTAVLVVDASIDPTYVILIVQVTITYPRQQCCLTNGEYTGGPVYQMRVKYRVAKTAFTCLCPLCFEKYDEELVLGSDMPCLTFPSHLRVSPRAEGATADQLAEANAHCGDADYQPNIDCAVPEGCGHTLCTYEAQDTGGTLQWIYISGICIEGCICPDHDGIIAAGFPQPKFAGQALSVDTNCVTGDRPCSTILGRCCYVDGDTIACIDDIDECDCYSEHSGCWDVGTGIDCAHPDAGFCNCVTPIGLCCYDDSCTDGVTEAECGTLSSGAGCWIEQNADHSDFSCANDRGGCSSCGTACPCSDSSACGYSSVPGASPTGYVWNFSIGTCSPGCACPVVDDAFNTLHGYPPGDGSGFIFTKCADCA